MVYLMCLCDSFLEAAKIPCPSVVECRGKPFIPVCAVQKVDGPTGIPVHVVFDSYCLYRVARCHLHEIGGVIQKKPTCGTVIHKATQKKHHT